MPMAATDEAEGLLTFVPEKTAAKKYFGTCVRTLRKWEGIGLVSPAIWINGRRYKTTAQIALDQARLVASGGTKSASSREGA